MLSADEARKLTRRADSTAEAHAIALLSDVELRIKSHASRGSCFVSYLVPASDALSIAIKTAVILGNTLRAHGYEVDVRNNSIDITWANPSGASMQNYNVFISDGEGYLWQYAVKTDSPSRAIEIADEGGAEVIGNYEDRLGDLCYVENEAGELVLECG